MAHPQRTLVEVVEAFLKKEATFPELKAALKKDRIREMGCRLMETFQPGTHNAGDKIGIRIMWKEISWYSYPSSIAGNIDAGRAKAEEEARVLGIPAERLQVYIQSEGYSRYTGYIWYDVPDGEVDKWIQVFYPYIGSNVGGRGGEACALYTPWVKEVFHLSVKGHMKPWADALQLLGAEVPDIYGVNDRTFHGCNMEISAEARIPLLVADKLEKWWREHPEVGYRQMQEIWSGMYDRVGRKGFTAEVHGYFFETKNHEEVAKLIRKHISPQIPGEALIDKRAGVWYVIDQSAIPGCRFVKTHDPSPSVQKLTEMTVPEASLKAFLDEAKKYYSGSGIGILEAFFNDKNGISRFWRNEEDFGVMGVMYCPHPIYAPVE